MAGFTSCKGEIMSYDEAFCDAPYDTAEGDAEQAAHHQRSLDVLYLIGNQYDVRIDHMRNLCDVAGISFEEFCKYTWDKS
mgnify:CR=1 FL=1